MKRLVKKLDEDKQTFEETNKSSGLSTKRLMGDKENIEIDQKYYSETKKSFEGGKKSKRGAKKY